MRVRVIISGGQTGADQGGLLAGRQLGLTTGGTAPKGWLTEVGPKAALLAGFGLVESVEPGYAVRTKANVLAADGTLLIGAHHRGGSALTARVAQLTKKPLFKLAYAGTADVSDERMEEFRYWLKRFGIEVLNVAGSRESESPGIQGFTTEFLVRALSNVSRV